MAKKPAKRAANREGGKAQYDRTKDRYICNCTLTDESGISKRHFFSGKTPEIAYEKMRKARSEATLGVFADPKKHTLQSWAKLWLETYCINLRPNTVIRYDSDFRVHILPYLGSYQLLKLTPQMVQGLINSKKNTLSPKSIKNMVGTLHAALEQAVKCDIIRKNPCDSVVLPKAPKYSEVPPCVLDEEQTKRFLAEIKGTEYEYYLKVSLFTGLRKGELCGLTWDCVNFKNNSLVVNKQLIKLHSAGGAYQLAPTKTGNTRIVDCPKSIMDILRNVKKQQAENHMNCNAAEIPWENEWNLVFTHANGKHLDVNGPYHALKYHAEKIGLENLRLHDLRHTYATNLCAETSDIKLVSEALGHSTIQTTMRYAHRSEKKHQEAAQKMEALFKAVN